MDRRSARAVDREPGHVRLGPARVKKSHLDLLAAVASGFVAALALATSTYNVYLQRQQVRASVWPKLVFHAAWDARGAFTLSVQNRGSGPAQIERQRVSVDGAARRSWPDALRALTGKPQVPTPGIDTLETTLSPGQEVKFLTLDDPGAADSFTQQIQRLTVEACYCSTLDDCWTLVSAGEDPDRTVPERDCAPDRRPFVPFEKGDRVESAAPVAATGRDARP